MIAAGPKIIKEKKNLLSELEELMEKLMIMESSLRHQLTELLDFEDRETFKFLFNNFTHITSLFDKFGKSELVALGLAKDVAIKLLGHMGECHENWAVVGAGLEESSTAISALVLGPALNPEQVEDSKALMEHTGSNRAALISTINELKYKVDTTETRDIKYIKSNFSKDQLRSYNYIMNELTQKLLLNINDMNKELVSEEKVYIGYHLSVV